MGEYTNLGLVTVVGRPGCRPQVLGKDAVWHDVTPVNGALLVNLGDQMARLTNDR